jgi:hypothetical protein
MFFNCVLKKDSFVLSSAKLKVLEIKIMNEGKKVDRSK